MGITIKTTKLQEMVSRSIKGASCAKTLPITQMMAIELKDGELTLITTDGSNTLYIREPKVAGEDFYVVIPVDRFSKLVSRTTSENIVLGVNSKSLIVQGNGKYSIELPIDDGAPVRFPDPLSKFRDGNSDLKPITIYQSTIQAILMTIKPALAVTLEAPCYTGYYVGDTIVGTDTYKIACMKNKMLDEPRLISPEMMNLLSVMDSEKISAYIVNNVVVFSSPSCEVYGTFMEGIDEYSIDAIMNLVDMEFGSSCKLNKQTILQVLDRLMLFVDTYDKNGVYLTFASEGLQISSKSSSGVEVIDYLDSSNFKSFTCCVDIEMLVTQIKAQAADVLELHYGLDNAIKLTEGNITQIVSLLDDDRIEG